MTTPSRSGRPLLGVLLACVAATLVVGLFALGTWQLQRRSWKLDLMARIAQRVHAVATPAPGPAQWPHIDAAGYEYRHVSARGVWMAGRSTWVQAVTELGGGYWLLTPLREDDGHILLVNRGFVPTDQRSALDAQLAQAPSSTDSVVVTGLLRLSEPGGGFLRHNDPNGNRWYSRDVPAIATAHALSGVAPYFMDADAAPAQQAVSGATPQWPAAGMTVLVFHNNHLVYALTWYTLALLLAGATWKVVRDARRVRNNSELPHLNQDDTHARHL
ncbi:SURF1 family protein [Rhodoferax sp.]|uniref:SURF1 family protein n=1 Tax=Rhodoferax sp. TaxID=50421 RepID=UPI00283B3AA3|nr:SURF1 family protein [Rhodoferax sp.]MDR3369960.1 SURF1 family protein [Rhodoferax sp.]